MRGVVAPPPPNATSGRTLHDRGQRPWTALRLGDRLGPYCCRVEIAAYPARFAFYGTLRPGGGALERLGLSSTLIHVGRCIIPGGLYVISWYPGLVPGGDPVVGDLFLVPDAATVGVLDRFEGYDADNIAASLYVRQEVPLIDPPGMAWVYRWTGDIAGRDVIVSGDWLAHRAQGATG